MRLGHLASDLARISTFLENSMNIRAVKGLLEESKFFIEWTAPEASFQIQVLLSEMQSKLALWQYCLVQQKKNVVDREEIKKKTESWSAQLLKIAGFAVKTIPPTVLHTKQRE